MEHDAGRALSPAMPLTKQNATDDELVAYQIGRRDGMDADTIEAQQVALRMAGLCGRLCAIVEWLVERDGECLGDNPHQLAVAKNALADARAIPGVS